ncbi:DNA cytosine methyltransferase [Anaeromyxobacter dehalogenans]|uniref:Cytosine-specific methyltransferase n=1 Tax=Anaeromyxobacter dehalogenans (strain 2CP-C) TaxID=290397 RepID=Q2IF55_ANADE|nr:DNA (cytosine-5-)-methyltransferase [Anaeromyxobacter dehalogenans]ABC83209.1 DNA-cytosine methyltransferase [Anaeromyxobacter dehalogenans 2CP-C]
MLSVAGLFAGIGGLELGMARSGHHTKLLCENDACARAVLDARFPEVPKHGDIRTLERLPKDTSLVTAGFPCQDLSQAGKTAGILGSRSGLVGEVFRLLEQSTVPWILLENVPFMLQLSRGRAMDVIVQGFETLGYRWAYRVVDTRAFGLPQRRERVFFLASLEEDPRSVLFADEAGAPEQEDPAGLACGFYWTEGVRGLGWAVNAVPTLKGGSTIGIPSAPAILLPSGEIVKPALRDLERLQGFQPDWTKPAEAVAKRGYRWKLVGNAVTVDVAAWIGDRLARPLPPVNAVGQRLLPGSAWPRAAWNVGDGRFCAPLSAWPVRRRGAPLHRFLKDDPELLSAKATAGFLGRARTSTLRFPPGFLASVDAHLRRMQALAAA